MKHDKGVQGIKFSNYVYEFCEGCIIGKSHPQSFHVQLFRPCVNTLNVFVHMNVCGPMSTPSINGAQFFLFCLRMIIFHFIEFTTSNTSLKYFLASMNHFFSTNRQVIIIQVFHGDHGDKYININFNLFYSLNILNIN